MSEIPADLAASPEEELPRYVEGYRVAVQEVKLSLDHAYQSLAAQKEFGKIIFAASSLVISLIAALQIFSRPPAPEYRDIVSFLLTLSVGLYLVLIYLSLQIVRPTKVTVPFKATFEVMYEAFIGREDEMLLLDQLLVNYLKAIKNTRPVIARTHRKVICSTWILGVLVFLIFATNYFVSLS